MKILTKKTQNNAMHMLINLSKFILVRYKRFFDQDEELLDAVVKMLMYLSIYIAGAKGLFILDQEVFNGYRNGHCVEIADDEI